MSHTSEQLYQELILEHHKHPRNYGRPVDCTHCAEGFNPLCGDHLWVYLKVNETNQLEDIRFDGCGCAISRASASLMTSALKGRSVPEAQQVFARFLGMLKGDLERVSDGDLAGVQKLDAFSGVWRFPSRVKCAALAWHAMSGALAQEKSVTTEVDPTQRIEGGVNS